MATFTQRIQNNNNDGGSGPQDDGWRPNDMRVGKASDVYWNMGVRFNVDIPKGSTITNAKITFTSNGNYASGTPTFDIYGIASDNTPALNSSPYIQDRTKTTAKTAWTVGEWVNNSEYDTPNIASVIQEIIDRAGWARNNAVGIFIDYRVANTFAREPFDYNSSTAKAALLTITYKPPTSVQTINGVSFENVKTINEVAVANIKTINGIS